MRQDEEQMPKTKYRVLQQHGYNDWLKQQHQEKHNLITTFWFTTACQALRLTRKYNKKPQQTK